MRVGLIGCVKTQVSQAKRAEDLFESPLFFGRRNYVDKVCDRWFIMSAVHGLTRPGDFIESYDTTLADVSVAARRTWSNNIITALRAELGGLSGHIFEIHAGADYRAFGLVKGLRAAGGVIELPTEGLSLAQQVSFYKKHASVKSPKPVAPPRPQGVPAPAVEDAGKYSALADWLGAQTDDALDLSFQDVEQFAGVPLPLHARRSAAQWSGSDTGGTIGAVIAAAGWHVTKVNITRQRVELARA